MKLTHISILNYRSLREVDLDLSPKINCLLGKNGEGKTNFLDAIYFLSFTKSGISAVDSQNIRHGEDFFMLNGKYELRGSEEVVSCGLKLNHKKQFRRNKKDYKRMSEHIGLLPLVMVSPDDYGLITGGSEERRRFMDIVISQYSPTYISALLRYNKALQQRNALLKQEEEPDAEMMSTLESMMAMYGEAVYAERDKFIRELVPVFQDYYTRISGNRESVGLEFVSHCQRGPLLEVISRDRAKDRVVGYSLHGVHKDDLVMTIGGYPVKREGSQGQSKTFLVSLKMAQFEFLRKANNGVSPLLLLDDIFDKLDADRVGQIVSIVSGDSFGQIFITDTNRENLDRILCSLAGEYKMFEVKDGLVREVDSVEE